MNKTKCRVICALLATMMFMSSGCLKDKPEETKPQDTRPPESSETESTEPEDDPGETQPVSDGEYDENRIYNYLNGKTVTAEEQNRRPVAIMINNIINSLPQVGIGNGDIFYECSAEGGITRIMMLTTDYANLGTIGSIRSSRDYFVDFLFNHDALYVNAGGSPKAYEKLINLKINDLDAVTMYLPEVFWRDNVRMNNMGYEHSLMTSGKALADAFSEKQYRTTLEDGFTPMFKFYAENTDNVPEGEAAEHLHMQSTPIQTVDFVYSKDTHEYLRYQYNGMEHVDGATGEQLSIKNVIVLFTDIYLIAGDTSGRLGVDTVGSGCGYYLTNGVRKYITWSRDSATGEAHLEYADGDELILNCGKTFICIVDDSVESSIDFNYKW